MPRLLEQRTLAERRYVQSAINTAHANVNQNLDALREDMLQHMVKAPRRLSQNYLCSRIDGIAEHQLDPDPPARAWQK
jgi:hypothetical protein